MLMTMSKDSIISERGNNFSVVMALWRLLIAFAGPAAVLQMIAVCGLRSDSYRADYFTSRIAFIISSLERLSGSGVFGGYFVFLIEKKSF